MALGVPVGLFGELIELMIFVYILTIVWGGGFDCVGMCSLWCEFTEKVLMWVYVLGGLSSFNV